MSNSAASNSAPINCRGLSRWYGEVQGLSGLTADIGPGVVGLLGPNGSGKSTLMRLLTGQIKASRGQVFLFGEEIRPGSWQAFSRIGYAPGDDVHFEDESAEDFLRLMSQIAGDSAAAAKTRAEQALAATSMEEHGAKRLREMSKGMRQRIKFAQSILFDPEVLLLDEPLNGMDPISRRATIDLVRKLGDEGRTVLMASHVLHEVESITDNILLLHHGRLLAEGRLGEIRSLIGSRPREVAIETQHPRKVAAALLSEELACGMRFSGSRLLIETTKLDQLLARLSELGSDGMLSGLDIEDHNLETLFNLLVGETA